MSTATKTWSWATSVESWTFVPGTYWTGALDTSVGNPTDSLKANVNTADNNKTDTG